VYRLILIYMFLPVVLVQEAFQFPCQNVPHVDPAVRRTPHHVVAVRTREQSHQNLRRMVHIQPPTIPTYNLPVEPVTHCSTSTARGSPLVGAVEPYLKQTLVQSAPHLNPGALKKKKKGKRVR
jgi:hypothetical protein